MRAIQKGPEPVRLKSYRAVPGATYDGKDFTPVKEDIRDALLRDQLALCCYCARRISKEQRPLPTNPDGPLVVQMKVEHWQSQANFKARQLDWTNLLGSCLGGMGTPPSAQTCDTRKGEAVITLNPLDPAHISTLRCSNRGYLESTDRIFQQDIDERLGLNHRVLVEERKASLDKALHPLKARYPKSEIPESALRSLINELEAPMNGKLPALVSVLRLWARRRFGSQW